MFHRIMLGFALCATQIGALAEVAPDAFVLQLSTEVIDAVKNDKAIQAGDVARIRTLVDSKVVPNVISLVTLSGSVMIADPFAVTSTVIAVDTATVDFSLSVIGGNQL